MNENTLQDEIILKQDELIEKQTQKIKRLYELTGQYKKLVEMQVSQKTLVLGTQILHNLVTGTIGQAEKMMSAIKEKETKND